MTESQPWRQRIIDRAPLPLLTHAHEVAIAIAMVLIAIPLINGDVKPESVHAHVPTWLASGWAWGMLVGAGLTIAGLFSHRPRVEWSGQLLLGYALGFYGLAVLVGAGLEQGGLVCVLFVAISVVSFWRAFKITSQPLIQRRLDQEVRRHSRDITGGHA